MVRASVPCPESPSLTNLPPIIFGCGTFSNQYTDKAPPARSLIREAYDSGIRAFDTSPYYGDSETILGDALQNLFAANVRRDEIFVTTKCGRYGLWDFDYSPDRIRKSVLSSLEKLNLAYLDVVLMHDVEFVSREEAVAAATVLFDLKDQGIVKNVGLSGYPLPTILDRATFVGEQVRPLDVVLSYSNFNIQNTLLAAAIPQFHAIGVKVVLNASPLSMGLLRREGPPSWHPASPELKQNVLDAIGYLDSRGNGEQLGRIAISFALSRASDKARGIGSTVVGFTDVPEVKLAVDIYLAITTEDESHRQERESVEEGVRNAMGSGIDMTWTSPPPRC